MEKREVQRLLFAKMRIKVLLFRKLNEVKVMVIDPSTTKYMIKANIKADGIVETVSYTHLTLPTN